MGEFANAPDNPPQRVIGSPSGQRPGGAVETFAMQQYNALAERVVKLEERLLQLEQRVFL